MDKKKLLVVVDMQNDFIDGALGIEEARNVVDPVCEKIKSWDGDVVYTMDTHDKGSYLSTTEGTDLPVEHCISGTKGWDLNNKVYEALWDHIRDAGEMCKSMFVKWCFGSYNLMDYIQEYEYEYVELIGLCTDVCVISNAVMIRNMHEHMRVVVDASCCAGVTPDSHRIALSAMKQCGIQIINEDQ